MRILIKLCRSRVALAVVLATLAVACASLVPRQGWDQGHGPVVPHRTFPADCSLCHVGGSWTEIRPDFEYDHEAETGVSLRGAHEHASCLRCHNDRGPVEQFAARGCGGCHVDVHRANLGKDCQDCHTETNWRPDAMIARHDRTRFPLVGAHVATACFRCHPGAQVGNFAGADPNCLTCHTQDLARVTVPDHQANGWTNDCERCHAPFGWTPARFLHPASFPLSAGHGGLRCGDCHTGGAFTGLSTDCASCHLGTYMSTREPQHAAAGFGTSCDDCHGTTTWSTANYRHPMSFPLNGAHSGQRCNVCHGSGVYAGLPSQCVDCHLDDYQRAQNPNHVASGFSTNCAQCHSTIHWGGGNFAHSQSFPLTAGHAGLQCAQCHTGGGFNAVSRECSSCHLDDYQATTDPNHAALGFGTSCDTCHSTTRWPGATFSHAFPVQSGRHAFACTECHQVPGNPSVFSCTHCHDHSQPEMADEHDEVGGYTWSSPACFQCHPTGN